MVSASVIGETASPSATSPISWICAFLLHNQPSVLFLHGNCECISPASVYTTEGGSQSFIIDCSVRDNSFVFCTSKTIEDEHLPRGRYESIAIYVVVLLGHLTLYCSIVQPVAETLPESDLLGPAGLLKDLHFAGICLAWT